MAIKAKKLKIKAAIAKVIAKKPCGNDKDHKSRAAALKIVAQYEAMKLRAKKALARAIKKSKEAKKNAKGSTNIADEMVKKGLAASANPLTIAKADSKLVSKFLKLAGSQKDAPKAIIKVAQKQDAALKVGIDRAKS